MYCHSHHLLIHSKKCERQDPRGEAPSVRQKVGDLSFKLMSLSSKARDFFHYKETWIRLLRYPKIGYCWPGLYFWWTTRNRTALICDRIARNGVSSRGQRIPKGKSHLDNLPEEYEAISPKKALVKQDLSGTLKSPLNYFWLLWDTQNWPYVI